MDGLPKSWQRKNIFVAVSITLVIYLCFISGYLFPRELQLFPNEISSISKSPPVQKPTPATQPPTTLEAIPEPTPTPTSPFDPTKLAFLVETRPIPHLPALFSHMISVVPPEWRFMFMGSPESIAHMRKSRVINSHEASGKLEIRLLPSNYSVASRESISQMFTDPNLYSGVLYPAEHLLVFQPDSIFCVNSEQSLNDWLEWDWVGAPWGPTIQSGGNGGLSLRKVSRILKVLGRQKRRKGDGALEDLWLAERLKRLEGHHMPNATISKRFSVESVWDDRPLGYHIGWLGVHHEQIWDTKEQLDHIWEYCPEVKLILGMSLAQDKPPGVD